MHGFPSFYKRFQGRTGLRKGVMSWGPLLMTSPFLVLRKCTEYQCFTMLFHVCLESCMAFLCWFLHQYFENLWFSENLGFTIRLARFRPFSGFGGTFSDFCQITDFFGPFFAKTKQKRLLAVLIRNNFTLVISIQFSYDLRLQNDYEQINCSFQHFFDWYQPLFSTSNTFYRLFKQFLSFKS